MEWGKGGVGLPRNEVPCLWLRLSCQDAEEAYDSDQGSFAFLGKDNWLDEEFDKDLM